MAFAVAVCIMHITGLALEHGGWFGMSREGNDYEHSGNDATLVMISVEYQMSRTRMGWS